MPPAPLHLCVCQSILLAFVCHLSRLFRLLPSCLFWLIAPQWTLTSRLLIYSFPSRTAGPVSEGQMCLWVSYFSLAASCVHTQLYHALFLWVCKFLDLSCFCACLYNRSGVGTPLADSLRRLSELLSAWAASEKLADKQQLLLLQ